jgi:mediator of RNA polymerase II transcription subunit 12
MVSSSSICRALPHLITEIPSDAKAVPFDPFRNYPDLPISDLPPDLPAEYRNQLISLLPHLPATASVLNLVNTYRDLNGNLVYGSPVINRPWEWIENLGESSIPDSKEEGREREEKERLKAKHLVKNSGSLPLESFGARMTGDGILPSVPEISSRIEGNIRAFEDGLSAENIFKRDWRETRVELEPELLSGNPMGRLRGQLDQESSGSGILMGGVGSEKRSTPRGSPASSVVSRSSARGSNASMRQSPGQISAHKRSNSSITEPIDVDSIPTTSSTKRAPSKRKAAAVSNSDDEVEIVDGPHPMRPTAAKKPKMKAAAKTRAKKK